MSYQGDFSTVKRLAKRASYDEAVIHAILDEGLVASVGFIVAGRPVVIPCAYLRDESTVYLHGSVANRMLRTLAAGGEACLTVTHLDGLVLARSAFHHSMNYRSAVIYGRGREAVGEERVRILDRFVDHFVEGRGPTVRGASEAELRQTLVVALPIDEASAKIRGGPALDDEDDYALEVWAGVLPLRMVAGEPLPDARLAAGVACPREIATWEPRRRGA